MLPNELLLEIIQYLNKNDLACLIFVNKNICQLLYTTETIKYYQRINKINLLYDSMYSLSIFKTVYYSEPFQSDEDIFISACVRGHLEVVKFLAANDKNLIDSYAFNIASRYGNLEVVNFLALSKTNLISSDNNAIYLAAIDGHFEVVKFLVTNRVLKLSYDYNIVVYCADKFPEIVKFLEEHKKMNN